MGKLKSKDRQARPSSQPVRRTSEVSEASQQQREEEEQQQGPQQRPPPSRRRPQGPVITPAQLKATFATGSSHPDASIPLTNMLAYTYADEAMQAEMRAASPLLRHAIAYRSASGHERRRMRESLPDVIEQEKRQNSSLQQQVAFHRPYTAPKCPTRGVKVPGIRSSCQDRRCHCNTACTGGEDCVLCATYMAGRGAAFGKADSVRGFGG
ncbi:hypothetical protein GJ744_005317 [Endocarpon pusillum]|uniref:Uncharacterized protein n=1 Tax=Endocarpon pusillum TaxID=364733 RepID=A0A8H7AQ98_9EURO|nr:hypothetical protein GJ744_005317 [Endocarpon pusillum]